MNANYNSSLLNITPQPFATIYHKDVSSRSGDMRAVILSRNEINIVRAIQESISRSFGEISSETQPEADKNA
jgi:hypothetical protein